MSRRSSSVHPPEPSSTESTSQPLGEFMRGIFDEANETLMRMQRDAARLRELKQRAEVGFRALGDAAKEEIDLTFNHLVERLAERVGKARTR
jgi:hypothetical protein